MTETNKNGGKNPKKSGYEVLEVYKKEIGGIKFEIWTTKCLCCNSIFEFYYLDDIHSLPKAAKIEVIKRGM